MQELSEREAEVLKLLDKLWKGGMLSLMSYDGRVTSFKAQKALAEFDAAHASEPKPEEKKRCPKCGRPLDGKPRNTPHDAAYFGPCDCQSHEPPTAEKPRLMVDPWGVIHEECPDCRGKCSEYTGADSPTGSGSHEPPAAEKPVANFNPDKHIHLAEKAQSGPLWWQERAENAEARVKELEATCTRQAKGYDDMRAAHGLAMRKLKSELAAARAGCVSVETAIDLARVACARWMATGEDKDISLSDLQRELYAAAGKPAEPMLTLAQAVEALRARARRWREKASLGTDALSLDDYVLALEQAAAASPKQEGKEE